MKPTKEPKAPEQEKPAYKPTPAEAKAVAAYMAAKETRGPPVNISFDGIAARIELTHPDEVAATAMALQSIGTTDLDFFDGMMFRLANASVSNGEGSTEMAFKFMLSVIKGIEPRDQIEAMLAAQMAAVHMATMTFARRLALADNIPQQDSAERAFNKLTRTFAAQVSALKEYRSKGEQKMTVQHVHVAEGGQAIVGNVSAPAEGVGARKKTEDQPHAKQIAYAPGVEMPRQIETERATVSRPSGTGL